MAKDFGITWWGEKWLNSLTNIDYQNRIPRGARYARNGSVKEITFGKNGIIKARVQGSRPSPYKIELRISQFDEQSSKKLLDNIISHPVILSKLLNCELDPQILDIAHNCNLKVFPSSWKDLGMNCSCPDWAVPCKHIASVIYIISKEIDNNPFVVFSLHGLDLKKEIERRGIKMSTQNLMAVTPASNFLKTLEISKKNVEPWNLDLSRISNLTEDIINILDESPAFKENFRDSYKSLFNKRQKILSKLKPEEDSLPHRTEIRLITDKKLNSKYIIDNDKKKEIDTGECIVLLRNLENRDTTLLHPSVLAFYKAYQFARTLVLNGCIVPMIVELDTREYRIIWLPALMDQEVKNAFESFDRSFDSSFVLDEKQNCMKDASTIVLCSLITEMMTDHTEVRDKITGMFFNGSLSIFKTTGEIGIPENIKSWLSCYYLSENKYRPYIIVNDTGKGFGIELGFSIEGVDIGLKSILSSKKYEDNRYAMLQQASLLFKYIPKSSEYIDSGAKDAIELTDLEFSDFLAKSISTIRLLNVRVILPKSLQEIIHPKPTLKIKSKTESDKKGYIRIDDLIDFNWEISIGNVFIPISEFNTLVKSAKGLIRFKKSFFFVDNDDLLKIKNAIESPKGPGKMRLLQAAICGEYEGAPIEISDEIRNLIKKLTSTGDIPVPESLTAVLRPYQIRGYSWIYKNMQLGFGCILADDMGLGKTIQIIALIAKMKEEGELNEKKILLVVPTSLITNWESELNKFAPSLTYFRYHGSTRNIENFSSDILITTYGILRSDNKTIASKKWNLMIIDEAQNIKNTDTEQTKSAKSIPAKTKIALSGTPVENRLTEYWSIMDFVNKGYLDTKKNFIENFSVPIQELGDLKCAEKFRRITAPFMIRRLKTDKTIINDLPDKITRNFSPVLTSAQAALYQQVVTEAMHTLESQSKNDDNYLFKRQGIVLQMIISLKQICDHPSLFIKDGKTESEISGKCMMLLEMVQNIIESGEKVLIFTQFKEMGDILQTIIEQELKVPTLFYHGGCSLKKRTDMVKRFQENKYEQVFILSLKAAGTGLNLTASSNVIHFDLWWNPAVEQQATDRAFRIGQHKNVLVTRFVTSGTFEEKIDRMIEMKKTLSNLTVSAGENWIGQLSDKEIKELVSL